MARDVGSVQALCERLSASGDLAGQQVGLDGRTVSVIKCADAVVPKAWGSIAMIPVLEDTTSSVRGLFKLRKANSKSTVCTVSSSATAPATHLSDGVLKLRAESCITFDRSCTDFKLSNITAKGVTPVYSNHLPLPSFCHTFTYLVRFIAASSSREQACPWHSRAISR